MEEREIVEPVPIAVGAAVSEDSEMVGIVEGDVARALDLETFAVIVSWWEA